MKLELVTGLDGSRIITESGIKSPIGNRHFAVGEAVWVDGSIVFGSERNSQPVVIHSTGDGVDNLITMYLYNDASNLNHIVIYDVKNEQILNDLTLNFTYDIGNTSMRSFTYNKRFTKLAMLYEDYTTRALTAYIVTASGCTVKTFGGYMYDVMSWYTCYFDDNDKLINKVFINDSGNNLIRFITYVDGVATNISDMTSFMASTFDRAYSIASAGTYSLTSSDDESFLTKGGTVDDYTVFEQSTSFANDSYTASTGTASGQISMVNDYICLVNAESLATACPNHLLDTNCANDVIKTLYDATSASIVIGDETKTERTAQKWKTYNSEVYAGGSGYITALSDGTIMSIGSTNRGVGEGKQVYFIENGKITYTDTNGAERVSKLDLIIHRKNYKLTCSLGNSGTGKDIGNTIVLQNGFKLVATSLTPSGVMFDAYFVNNNFRIPYYPNGNVGQVSCSIFPDAVQATTNKVLILRYAGVDSGDNGQTLKLYKTDVSVDDGTILPNGDYIYNSTVLTKTLKTKELNALIEMIIKNKDIPSS